MERPIVGSHKDLEDMNSWEQVFETVRAQYEALLRSDVENQLEANSQILLRIRDFEEKVADLPDDDQIGQLFEKTKHFCQNLIKGAETHAEQEIVRHRFRRLFGVRYSSLLLANLASTDPTIVDGSSSFQAAAQAAVEEALQWHEEAVLGHVLIYYQNRGDDAENLLHHCAIVNLPGVDKSKISESEITFREALRIYVKTFGSSVRTKEHLRVVPLSRILAEAPMCDETGYLSASRLRTVPLPAPKTLSEYNDALELPEEAQRLQGNQKQYREVVRAAFAKVLNLSEDFETKHYSAGSDDLGKTPMRATAHLYVVFRKKKDDLHLDYVLAMRETLARVTMAYAVDKMQSATTTLKDTRRFEQESRKQFEEQVRHLSVGIGALQTEAEKVISSLTPSVWTSLFSWIESIKKISSTKTDVFVTIGRRFSTPANHKWELSQWAMALLKLVDATEGEFPPELSDVVAAWRYLSRNFLDGSVRTAHPMWRSLHRMGVPMADEFSEESIAEFYPRYKNIRSGFSEALGSGVFAQNGFTVMFLFFALGAKFDEKMFARTCGRQIRLSPVLRAERVIDGINLLHDELVGWGIPGVRSAPVRVDSELHQLTIELKIAGLDFKSLCERMAEMLGKKRHPGWDIGSTSMAIFAALGLNEDTWSPETIRQIQISLQASRVSRGDKSGHEVAACTKTEDGLLLSYQMTESVETTTAVEGAK